MYSLGVAQQRNKEVINLKRDDVGHRMVCVNRRNLLKYSSKPLKHAIILAFKGWNQISIMDYCYSVITN